MNCKNCKYFDNTKTVDTAHNPNDRQRQQSRISANVRR